MRKHDSGDIYNPIPVAIARGRQFHRGFDIHPNDTLR
jgi:hypothetical protein